MKPVKDFDIDKNTSIEEFLNQMKESGGFQAKKVGEAVEILEEMIKRKCTKFLSFPADIIATGTRGIIKEMIKRKWFDVIITTCGTLDHDIARSFKDYYHGSFLADDYELREEGIHRLGNIFIPEENYGLIIEEKMRKWLPEIYLKNKNLATYELIWEIGKKINNENSILYWAWKNQIPIIVPGITDGAVGYQLWQFWQENHKDFVINVLKDEQYLSDLVWNSEKTGALILGGGISKHHTIWWNQFKDGLDYAVYISTATEWDGSLSGARPREAITWKKIKENAKISYVYGEITVVLPLIFWYLVRNL